MDIQSINDDIKTRQWIERIKECRESGLPVMSEDCASRTTYASRPTTAGLGSCERWQLNQGL